LSPSTGDFSAQDGDVFGRQIKTRLQLGVIELDEQRPDALLTRIVLGPNESANKARARQEKIR